jgi:5-methylcytosine-specific restriction endonuclease McrA
MVLGIFIWIISMAIFFGRSRKKSPKWKKQSKIRRPFPKFVRDKTLEDQNYKCANCGTKIYPPLIHFDHVDGNRSNNHISNCQALCPNCHTLKTDEDRRGQ